MSRFQIAGALVLGLLLAGGSSSAAETIRVNVANMAFTPGEVSAHVGDTIEWVSTDFVMHTATARDKQWDITIPPKGTGSVVLKQAGTIDYYCRFHPNMKGRITVADAAG